MRSEPRPRAKRPGFILFRHTKRAKLCVPQPAPAVNPKRQQNAHPHRILRHLTPPDSGRPVQTPELGPVGTAVLAPR
jgi:hypothetical protein